ncbi:ABC transporter substrate-binding protein [Mariniflexile ostreae]|uniref:ABC transporter substrate-binding protein n=1 Tax=Mariniflexile ostreae TaxID=1520892 RepID=A0ABV5F7X5_9FLAO
MRILVLLCSILFFFASCKDKKSPDVRVPIEKKNDSETIKYAKSFSVNEFETHKEIIVNSAWPNSNKSFRYLLVKKGQKMPVLNEKDVVIEIPVERVVVMSTTNIPALEYLNLDEKLIGFPNTDFISSEKTRAHIENGKIKDLNHELDLNMELLLELQPELVIGFSVNGNNKTLDQIEKFGIPVVLDGGWTEQHPLGRAEWIKFIAAFFDKSEIANKIFSTIETDYLNAKETALSAKEKPVVFSGSMFKDVWNVPGGKSFMAKYLEDANTEYIWKNNQATGSLQLNFENVLQKAQHAQFWIGAGAFENKEQMSDSHKGYTYFDAFKNNKIYGYTKQIGPKGGLLYYELGPLRPDIILKDMIYIAHPGLLEDYTPYFFQNLK